MLTSVLDSWIKVSQYQALQTVYVKVGKSRNDMISVNLDFPFAEVVSNLALYRLVVLSKTLKPCHCQRQLECLVLMQSSHTTCNALPQKWQVLLPNRDVI